MQWSRSTEPCAPRKKGSLTCEPCTAAMYSDATYELMNWKAKVLVMSESSHSVSVRCISQSFRMIPTYDQTIDMTVMKAELRKALTSAEFSFQNSPCVASFTLSAISAIVPRTMMQTRKMAMLAEITMRICWNHSSNHSTSSRSFASSSSESTSTNPARDQRPFLKPATGGSHTLKTSESSSFGTLGSCFVFHTWCCRSTSCRNSGRSTSSSSKSSMFHLNVSFACSRFQCSRNAWAQTTVIKP
mmetsp:Transcript_3354/g.8750  ORF Transcript_3354/g.8750 Transcript_3354/m.8750 type:complete len:244 (-) Transcript_3354:763-1494(-)